MADPTGGKKLVELQHKMSKKIAQLTKVIYHLNTRNEDADVTIKALTVQHEQEINMLLEDASNKIRRFKDELEKRNASGQNVSKAALEELEKRHAEEKEKCLTELAACRQKATAREEHATAEFKSRIKAMQRELDEAKENFKSTVKKLQARGGEEFNIQLVELRRKHAEDLQALEQAKQAAVSEAAVAAAAAEAAVEAEEEATQALEKHAKTHAEEVANTKAAHEASLRALEEELSAVRARALAGARDAAAADLLEVEQKFSKRTDALRAELERSRAGEERLKEELRISGERFEALEASLVQEKRERAIEQESANSTCEQVENLHRRLKEQTSTSAAELAKLENLLASLRAENASLGDKQAALESKLGEKSENITAMTAKNLSLVDTVEQKNSQLYALEERCTKLQSSLERAESLQNESQSAAADRTRQLESKLATANDSLLALERKVADERAENDSKLIDQDKKHRVELTNQQQAAAQDLEATRAKLQGELDAALDRYNAAQNDAAQRLEAMAQAHSNEIESLDKVRGERLKDLEAQLKSTSGERDQTLAESANLRILLETEQANSKRLSGDLEQCNAEIQSLRKQVEELDSSLVQGATQRAEIERAAEEKLSRAVKQAQAALDQSTSEWRQKLELEISSHNKDKSATVRDMEERLRRATEELEQHGAQRYAALSKELENTRSALDSARKQCDELCASHREQAERTEELHKREVAGLHARGEAALSEAKQAALVEKEAACASVQASERSERDAMRRELIGAKLAELASLREELTSAHKSNIEILTERGERSTRAALAEQAQKLDKEANAAAEEASIIHASALRKLNDRIGSLQEKIQSLEAQGSRLEQDKKDLKSEHKVVLERIAGERASDAEMYQSQIARIGVEHTQQLKAHKEAHHRELQTAKAGFESERAGIQEELSTQRKTVQYWEHRYEHREPRDEDVKKISKLSKKLHDAEETAQKAVEDMAFYKRELVNRETSYNKVFGSNLNVGVMNVVPGQQIGDSARQMAAKQDKEKRKKEKKEKKRRKKELEAEQQEVTKPHLAFPPLSSADSNSNNHSNNNHTNHSGSFNTGMNDHQMHMARREYRPEEEYELQETRSVVLERPKQHFTTNASPANFSRRLTLD